MRAEISANGTLSVLPESELEEYALSKWWEGFQPDGQGECSSALHVGIEIPLRPSVRQQSQLRKHLGLG
jgi:hypothetical protein